MSGVIWYRLSSQPRNPGARTSGRPPAVFDGACDKRARLPRSEASLTRPPFRDDQNASIFLALGGVLRQGPWRWAGQDPPIQIKARIMASAPDDRLARQILDRATFMSACGVKGQQLLCGVLKNQDSLAAHWHDDKMLLLQLRHFVSGQPGRPNGSGAGQRFEIAKDGV